MKLKLIIATIVTLILATTALAGSTDQGRRLAGPFCVGKANLLPFNTPQGWVSRAGVVRSVARTQECNSWENRKFGVAVQSSTTTITNPATPGPKGDTGKTGATGATGAQGEAGATGEQGPAGQDGKDGTNGLGNATLTICLDGHGGINQAPCEGNQRAVQVVIAASN